MRSFVPSLTLILATVALSACGGEHASANADTPSPSLQAEASTAAAAGPQTPDAGGKVITVTLTTDETGSYFKPKEFEAHQGDVIRFTLDQGVHNVHFLPDSNPGKSGLPPMSDMLQLPGQTYDLKVSMAPGKYYFQCDPHAALGMTGHVEVED
jgi:plastocyanin